MDKLTDSTLVLSALGRPLDLGTLYNTLNDQIVPGINLWEVADMNKHTNTEPQPKTNVRVEASETVKDKTKLLDVSASLKASFLCGLVEVGGSANYLNEDTTSAHQCRVTLKYSVTTEHKELNVSELKILDAEVLNNTDATHVVVEVTYGADALMEFEETASDISNRQEIQGNLNLMIKRIPSVEISGEGNVQMNHEDKEKVKKFTCKFYGDFKLTDLPSSYEEAVKVYSELPSLLAKEGEKAVPVKVWLYPLSRLINTESKLKKVISLLLVSGLEEAIDDLHQAKVKTNNLLERSKEIKAKDIVTKLEQFQRCLSDFTTGFKQKMASLIPAIRGGTMEETALTDHLKSKDVAGFSGKEMNQWLGEKETEINVVTMHIKKIKDYQIKCEGCELDSFLLSPDVSDGIVLCFTSLKYKEPYLNKITLRSTPQQNARVECPWYKRDDAMKAVEDSVNILKYAPPDGRVISFIKDNNYPGASVRWYRKVILKNPHVTCTMEIFACELTLDKDTAHPDVGAWVNGAVNDDFGQSLPSNPKRFDSVPQVLCTQPLPAGRSYWECGWAGDNVCIGVARATMCREGSDAWIGGNDKSWSLYCDDDTYYFCHNDDYKQIPNPPPGTCRVGVYLDREAGTLAFYSIDGKTHNCQHKHGPWYKQEDIKFTDDDLYAGFWIGSGCAVALI